MFEPHFGQGINNEKDQNISCLRNKKATNEINIATIARKFATSKIWKKPASTSLLIKRKITIIKTMMAGA
mgnify:CR=1 FL=1